MQYTGGMVRLLIVVLLSFLLPDPVTAAEHSKELRVGIRNIRPFIFQEQGAAPRGYSIDLWQEVAQQLGRPYRFVPSTGIAQTLQQMENGEIDMAIGAITITKGREEQFDFSYSHFHTGLGILIPAENHYSIKAFFSSFFTSKRLVRVGSFLFFLLFSAHVIWFVERRYHNTFHTRYFPGIFDGIYWSIVTASTVGYGDYTPKSKAGKILAVLIIITSLPLFAVFVANISSDITLHELHTYIHGPEDLNDKTIGVVAGSTSEDYLLKMHLFAAVRRKKAEELYKMVGNGQLDAVVHDLPSLQYYVRAQGKGKVKVVENSFDNQDYAFLFPEKSTLKEPVDRALLNIVESGRETALHAKWFGSALQP